MKVEKIITLTKDDIKTLRNAAYILEQFAGDCRCWTSRDIMEICNKSYKFEDHCFGVKVIYEEK